MSKDVITLTKYSYKDSSTRYKKREMILPDLSEEIEYVIHEYLDYRDVVFVLGAGTSYSDGAILQSQIIPYLLLCEDKSMTESTAFKIVTDFIKSYFDFDMTIGIFPTLEQIYGYLDYHINNEISLGRGYSVEKMKNVRRSLDYLLHYLSTYGSLNTITYKITIIDFGKK